MTAASAKDYLSKREIPQLFESLMTGLMYYRPNDHIEYLQQCLRKIKEEGIEQVKWNIFIESRKKTPLPPITPENGMRPARDHSFITGSENIETSVGMTNDLISRSLHNYLLTQEKEAPASLESKKADPLPPIGAKRPSQKAGQIALPDCPIALVMGGPGSGRATQCKKLIERYKGWVHISMGDLLRSQIFKKASADAKWGAVSQLVSNGELAPEELTIEMVKAEIGKHMDAKGIIIEGFPRTMDQVRDYEKYIGRVDLVFVLDCEEEMMVQRLKKRGQATGRVDDNDNAVAARIAFFKEKTLPAIKYFDDKGKVIIVDGDRDGDEIFYDLATLFDNVFFAKGEKPQAAMASQPAQKTTPSGAQTSSSSSQPNTASCKIPLPNCPITLVMGGPGSGRATQCKKLLERYKGWVHISMGDLLRSQIFKKASADAKWGAVSTLVSKGELAPEELTIEMVKAEIGKHMDAKGIIIEGFPRTMDQVADFEKFIGKCDLVFVLDCEEEMMVQRLKKRGQATGRVDDNDNAVAARITFFKEKTLPAIKYFDDKGKVIIVDGDRDGDEIFYDLATLFDNVFFAKNQPAPATGATPRPPSGGKPRSPRPGSTRYRPANRPGSGFTNVPVNIAIATPDTGRCTGLPTCPIILLMGGPGSGRETQAKTLAAAHPGFKLVSITAQDAKVADVKQQICAAAGASVIVLEGFPRNKQQLEDFNKHIGGADHAVLIDCEEATLRANCRDADITALVRAFKTGTLPILAHFDDHNRLSVVNGDRSTAEVTRDIEQAVTLFLIQATDSKARLSVAVPDTGRVAGLPACHVIAVLGAPGSGYEAHLAKAADKLKAKLVKGSVEEQLAAVKAAAPGSHVLIQGSPASAGQIEAFNKTIGGLSGAVVVDTSSEYNSKQGAAAAALAAFKSQTLPVLAYFDDRGKLQLVPGETGSVVDSLVAAITRCTAQM